MILQLIIKALVGLLRPDLHKQYLSLAENKLFSIFVAGKSFTTSSL